MVHVLAAPAATLVGAHTSDDTLALGVTLTVAVVLVPSVAVTVTVCGVATEAAVAVNVAEVDAAGTATEAGTGSAALLSDDSATALPPVGAGCVKLIVHVLAAPDARLVGAHASEDALGLGVSVTVAVVLPPSAAVTVIVCGAVTEPAVAENVADVAVTGTVTDAGTGNAAVLLDVSAATLPPAGAG